MRAALLSVVLGFALLAVRAVILANRAGHC